MTQQNKSQTPLAPLSAGRVAFLLLCLSSLLLLLFNADSAIASMRKALSLCANTVIPSLFPFMILSELIVHSGAANVIGRWLSPLFRFLFGIGGEGASALLLGLVSGFPVGGRTAAALYHEGRIDGQELSHLLCFCNLPSSAFVISAVGISLFGSRAFGLWLYAITLCSALLVGMGSRLLHGRPCEKRATKTSMPPSPPPVGVAAFTESVSQSARAMLTVCAFVVFFATLTGCMETLLVKAALPPILTAPLFSFLELSGGVAHAASVGGMQGMLLCALAVGWSGLSVHFQIMSICDGCAVSFRPYFASKAAQGVLNVLLLRLVLWWHPDAFLPDDRVHAAYSPLPPAAVKLTLALFALAIAVCLWHTWKNRKQKKRQPSHAGKCKS